MTSDAIVKITDNARAVLAFDQELAAVEAEIKEERARHARAMEVLHTKQQALQQAIFKLGAI